MYRVFILIFITAPILIYSQNENKSRFNGIWLDTVSEHHYQIEISDSIIIIKPKNYTAIQFNLNSKDGILWFDYSKTERITLALTDNDKMLWLDCTSSNEKQPKSVPLITVLRYIRKE